MTTLKQITWFSVVLFLSSKAAFGQDVMPPPDTFPPDVYATVTPEDLSGSVIAVDSSNMPEPYNSTPFPPFEPPPPDDPLTLVTGDYPGSQSTSFAVSVTSVPEPSFAALLSVTVVAMAARRVSRKK